MIAPISFKGHFINNSPIKQRSTKGDFKEIESSFVELKSGNAADRAAVQAVESNWGVNATFVTNMRREMNDALKFNLVKRRFFALTTQTDDFAKIMPKKILGMAEVITNSSGHIKLCYLQADPKNNMKARKPQFKGIGTAILNCIKKKFPGSDITLIPILEAKPFYLKNGFKEIEDGLLMIFRR